MTSQSLTICRRLTALPLFAALLSFGGVVSTATAGDQRRRGTSGNWKSSCDERRTGSTNC